MKSRERVGNYPCKCKKFYAETFEKSHFAGVSIHASNFSTYNERFCIDEYR
jgi:hypothetical protein